MVNVPRQESAEYSSPDGTVDNMRTATHLKIIDATKGVLTVGLNTAGFAVLQAPAYIAGQTVHQIGEAFKAGKRGLKGQSFKQAA